MLPDRISLKQVVEENDELKEVEKQYFYIFSYNSINSFRKAEGLTLEGFANIFSELVKPEDERDLEKVADANEYFGKLFYHALKEGMRIARKELDLTLEDVQAYINDPDNFESTVKIASSYQDSAFKPEEDKKKVKEAQL